MAQSNVTVTINGSDYPMACAPGEEDKVKTLGERIDRVASQIAAASGSIGESRLLVMAALILTDQLSDLEQKSSSSVMQAETVASQAEKDAKDTSRDDKMAEMIEQLAARLEALTGK